MQPNKNQTHIWLFSFADLAFLLLIAFTQASTIGRKPITIGEMVLPKVVEGPNVNRLAPAMDLYQIRVHKPAQDDDLKVFQLVAVSPDGKADAGEKISGETLAARLIDINSRGARKPVLVPDESSLSRDMLLGMSLIEKIWEDVRKVTIDRISDVVK